MKNESQVRSLVENWAKAVREEDIDGVLANHSDDICMFDVPEPLQSNGLAAYKQTWKVYFDWSHHSGIFDISELEITAGNDIAFCHGIIHCAGKESTGERKEYLVRLTMCFHRINEQWMITHEHHSVPAF